MTSTLSRYLRLFLCVIIAALVAASPDFDADAASKRRKRKTRTSRVNKRKSRSKNKRRSKSAPALPVVVLGSTDPIDAPEPFVTLPSVKEAPKGLDGRTIAIWPSHGKYFSGGWIWQRPKLFGTVEDMLSRSFVDPYIVPMLENAGAYVMLPRERDFSHGVTVIDHDWSTPGARFSSVSGKYKWENQGDSTGFGHRRDYLTQGDNPFVMGASGKVRTVEPKDSAQRSTASWYGRAPQEGDRAVYVSYQSYPNSATDATYTINHLGGKSEVIVNQQMGGGTWVYLGTYPFSGKEEKLPVVTLSNISEDEDAVVSADAVRIGGGMGQVARNSYGTPRPSGLPAFLEGARYYIQSAGFPDSVYSPNRGANDYQDDYMSRAHWVNHMTAGSVLFPDTIGMNIPVDLAFAFHTDAGVKTDSTVVGTLGLYSTDGGNPLGNGTSRYANRDLTASVTSQVIGDIRRLYDPNWTSRGNLDRRYYEVRETKVPAMIIELLSHQNFEDMKRALDPEFRFLVGRAIYKGILKFLSERYNQPYTVQPLPVNEFAINADGKGYYTLSWKPVDDPLEPTAKPEYYIVYESTADRYFHPVAVTYVPSWSTLINDDKLHAYYIVAANAGGRSFPSETLALYDRKHQMPSVEIVNGFTRVSGPEWTDGEEFAGFDFENRFGVPDGRDIHYIGRQWDFDPTSRLGGGKMGFGESTDTESTREISGNTRDYPIIHGEALRKAGRGFVSSSLKAFTKSRNTPKAVDLILGLQKTTRKAPSRERYFQTLSGPLRRRLAQYRRSGGSLLMSGSYLSSEIHEADSLTRDSMALFAADYIGYAPFIINDTLPKVPVATTDFLVAGNSTVKGAPSIRATELASLHNGNWVGAGNPQAIVPADDRGQVIARYPETGYPAALAVEGNRRDSKTGQELKGRVVVAGFPIEAMENTDSREAFIADAIQYLIGAEPPVVDLDRPAAAPGTKVTPAKGKKGKKDKKKKNSSKADKAAKEKAKPAAKPAAKPKADKNRQNTDKNRQKKNDKRAVPAPKPKESKAPKAVPHRPKNLKP